MLVKFDWNIILGNAMTNLGVMIDFALAKAQEDPQETTARIVMMKAA